MMTLSKIVGGGESWLYLYEDNTLVDSCHEDDKPKLERLSHLKTIGNMTHEEMARLWRFAPSGHPYFNTENPELFNAFKKRWAAFGGWNPALSKHIGWEP